MKETTKTRGTEGIKCSGAQILRFERRRTVLPEMKGSIPCAGDIIFYNEEPPGGFDRRGKNQCDKKPCQWILLKEMRLRYQYYKDEFLNGHKFICIGKSALCQA